MKINSIKISNALSFEEKDQIDECPEIKFVDGINVIIGENGSGKSNFLEILNHFMSKNLFRPHNYTGTAIRSYKVKGGVAAFESTIRYDNGQHVFKIPYNRQRSSHIQRIRIELGLTDKDKENLVFILKHLDEIHAMSKKYSNSFPAFPNVDENTLTTVNSITLTFEDVMGYKILNNVTSFADDVEQFISYYVENFYLLQSLIDVVNKEESKDWPEFKNQFTVLSSYRNYAQFESIFQIQQSETDEIHSAKHDLTNQKFLHPEEKEPKIFRYIRNMIGYDFHNLVTKEGLSNSDPVERFQNKIFLKLNEHLEKVLGFKLHIKRQDTNSLQYVFNFINSETNDIIPFSELSAGEKGIIQIFLTILGFDIDDGIIVIDEPELHMHPQMQDLFAEFILNLQKDFQIQFILCTHSPQLINSKTIDGVQKFYRDSNNFTNTLKPVLSSQDKDIVRYLDYFRGSKILFTDEVLLVEGDSDEYFYKFIFEDYKKSHNLTKNLEIIQIGGKEQYTEWNRFFKDWKITAYFIRDHDNFGGTDTDIENKYSENIFILKKGKLEDYIGGTGNNLENVLDFCQNRFQTWKTDSSFDEKRNELDSIFEKIIS